jgi:hypothetical protein
MTFQVQDFMDSFIVDAITQPDSSIRLDTADRILSWSYKDSRSTFACELQIHYLKDLASPVDSIIFDGLVMASAECGDSLCFATDKLVNFSFSFQNHGLDVNTLPAGPYKITLTTLEGLFEVSSITGKIIYIE